MGSFSIMIDSVPRLAVPTAPCPKQAPLHRVIRQYRKPLTKIIRAWKWPLDVRSFDVIRRNRLDDAVALDLSPAIALVLGYQDESFADPHAVL